MDQDFEVEKPSFDEGREFMDTGFITKTHLEESKVEGDERKLEDNEGNLVRAK